MSVFLTVTAKRQISQCSVSTQKLVHHKSGLNAAWQPQQLRNVSDYGHFYRNRQLELHAAKEARRLTLRQLVRTEIPWLFSRSPQPRNETGLF